MSLSSDEFVERVRVALGAANANQLADRLGLGAAGGQRVARWLKGENEPDYEATMLMLEKTGWLNINGVAEVAQVQNAPDARLEAIEALIAELPTAQDMKDALDAVLARLPPATPAEIPATQSKSTASQKKAAS